MPNDLLEFGRPAAYARTLASKRLRTAVLSSLLGACVGAAGALVLLESPSTALLAAVAAVAAVAVFKATAGPWHRVRAGIRAEVRVARRLRRCSISALVHGAMLGRGDADHIALGPCAVVVETKYARGRPKVNRRGEVVAVGHNPMPRDPVDQSRRQAQAVARRVGVPVAAVVCLVDMRGRPFDVDGVTVCSARDLRKVLGRLPRVLDPSVARRAAAKLDPDA